MREFPLIIFTVATQLACGLTMAATLFEMKTRPADAALMRPLGLAIFPLLAMGALVSMLHLGRPLLAWRSVLNLAQSRLSLEILATAVFVLLALAYSGFWWTGRADGRWILGVATSLAGVAAVLAASLPYLVPMQPAWNSGWLPASFLGTAVLLGGLAPVVLTSWKGNNGLLRIFLSATVAGSLLLLISAAWMIVNLLRTGDPFVAGRFGGMLHLLLSRQAIWLGCYIALAGLLPSVVAIRLWPEEGATDVAIAPAATAVFVVVLFGAAAGRALMYWLGAAFEPF